MWKKIALSLTMGTAVVGLYAGQAIAQNATLDKAYNETIEANLDNNVSVVLNKEIDVTKDLTLVGVVTISGAIDVSESAIAVIDNNQIINNNLVDVGEGELLNSATVNLDVLVGATGNIGLNIAAGDNNAQDNAAAITAITAVGGSADAEIFVNQESFQNNFFLGGGSVVNTSTVEDNLLNGAGGNIGVNVATGAYNIQKNALAVATVIGTAVLAEATAAGFQQAVFNITDASDTTNIASLGGTALGGATGNIGVNIVAGTNNLQANTLAVTTN